MGSILINVRMICAVNRISHGRQFADDFPKLSSMGLPGDFKCMPVRFHSQASKQLPL